MKSKNKERARLALAELEKEMEILTKEEMNTCKGGGSGTQTDPYTLSEYESLTDNPYFIGGWVRNTDGSLFWGVGGVTVNGGSSGHWEKEGKYDMKNCYACMCGELAKPAPGDFVRGGPI